MIERLPYAVWVNWQELMPILDDGTGPMEWTGDYAEVWATNKQDAKWKGYRAMKWWPVVQARDGLHPLAGVKAEVLVCAHGMALVGNTRECRECRAEIDAERAAALWAGQTFDALHEDSDEARFAELVGDLDGVTEPSIYLGPTLLQRVGLWLRKKVA